MGEFNLLFEFGVLVLWWLGLGLILGFCGSLTRLALPWLDFADRSRKITASASGRCHSGLLRLQTWVAVGRLYVCDVLCMYSVYVLGVFFFSLQHVGVCPTSVCHTSVCHVLWFVHRVLVCVQIVFV